MSALWADEGFVLLLDSFRVVVEVNKATLVTSSLYDIGGLIRNFCIL